MKLHMPHPHAPTFLHHKNHGNATEEAEHHKETFKEEVSHVAKEVSHVVEVTLDTVEKGVDAVDPLHVFSPNEIPIRLILPKSLFSNASDAVIPLVCARSNDPYHGLQVKATKSNELVIEDVNTQKPIIVIERTLKPRKYDIYKGAPVFDGQLPFDKSGDLFRCATVVRFDKVLGVTFEGQSEPTYAISKAGLAASFETKHWIKHVGKKEPVASTHPWQGTNDMMEVKPGEDVLLMFCLAAIAEDMLQ
jgi:hypothetical protein